MKKANRPCTELGCPYYAEPGTSKCRLHKRSHKHTAPDSKCIHRLYGSAVWKKQRAVFLNAHPLCVQCEKDRRLTPATTVDHKVPHRGDPNLFYDQSNWQPMCKPCHDRKTASEDGGFGNRRGPSKVYGF